MTPNNVAVMLLAGPIKYWWDDNWDLAFHWHYDAWREYLSKRFVDVGDFLVYRPHHAFKGVWTEGAQSVNDTALKLAHVIINMTPEGVLSEGTEGEILLASNHGAIVVDAPPPETRDEFETGFQSLLAEVRSLGVGAQLVSQEKIVESMGYKPGRECLFEALFKHYLGTVHRLHYKPNRKPVTVVDALMPRLVGNKIVAELNDAEICLPIKQLLKVEVLERSSL